MFTLTSQIPPSEKPVAKFAVTGVARLSLDKKRVDILVAVINTDDVVAKQIILPITNDDAKGVRAAAGGGVERFNSGLTGMFDAFQTVLSTQYSATAVEAWLANNGLFPPGTAT